MDPRDKYLLGIWQITVHVVGTGDRESQRLTQTLTSDSSCGWIRLVRGEWISGAPPPADVRYIGYTDASLPPPFGGRC